MSGLALFAIAVVVLFILVFAWCCWDFCRIVKRDTSGGGK